MKFNLLQYLNQLNNPQPNLQFSPAYGVASVDEMTGMDNLVSRYPSNSNDVSPGTYTPRGVANPPADPGSEFSWRNPYSYTPWGESEGFGDYLGNNMNLFGSLAGLGIAGLGAWTDFQQLELARDALKQEKKAFNINLTNQTQSYNTQVADRITGRHYATEADRIAALSAATLTDYSKYGKKKRKNEAGG